MNGISFINSKAARTIIYIFFVGGLLNLSAGVLWFIWNYGLTGIIGIGRVNFLESIGLIAFVYVFYFGYKFGEKKEAEAAANCGCKDNVYNISSTNEYIKQMSQKEKEELRNMISGVFNNRKETEKTESKDGSHPKKDYFPTNIPYSPLKQKKKI